MPHKEKPRLPIYTSTLHLYIASSIFRFIREDRIINIQNRLSYRLDMSLIWSIVLSG
jgi:hypothetical protein